MAAVMVLCLVIVPTAQANNGSNATTTTAATSTQQSTTQANATAAHTDINPPKSKSKKAASPADKSLLDDEVLDSPISYFREAFSSEEDSKEAAPSSDALTMTVKALVATLLSTIL